MPLTRNVIYIINSHLTSVLTVLRHRILFQWHICDTRAPSLCARPPRAWRARRTSSVLWTPPTTPARTCGATPAGAGQRNIPSRSQGESTFIVFNFSKNIFYFFRSKWSLSLEIEQSVRTEKSRLISMFSHEPSQVCRRRDNILILFNPRWQLLFFIVWLHWVESSAFLWEL